MPIDSEEKRRASVGVSDGELPLPDGTIDADDRAVLSGVYPVGVAGPIVAGYLSGRMCGDDMGYTLRMP